MANAIWSFLSSLALKLIGPLLAYLKGRGDVEKDSTEKALEAMREVKDIHTRIESDTDERNRVRDKYK